MLKVFEETNVGKTVVELSNRERMFLWDVLEDYERLLKEKAPKEGNSGEVIKAKLRKNEFLHDEYRFKKMQIQLPNGRLMPLEEMVKDYGRLLTEKTSKEETSKQLTAKLKFEQWYLIDRDVIDRNREEIHRVCEEWYVGKKCWERFEESKEIADEEPERYPRRIWTCMLWPNCERDTEEKIEERCRKIGEGMCDEVICDFELQMRICNGETAEDLFKKLDKLNYPRLIKLRNGRMARFGGGLFPDDGANRPVDIGGWADDDVNYWFGYYAPYVFRREEPTEEKNTAYY